MSPVNRDEQWRELEVLIASFQSTGKAQAFYVRTLLGFLALVWGWHSFSPSGDMNVQILGVSLRVAGLWPITPGVVALLVLGIIGTQNALEPIWQRLGSKLRELEKQMYFSDLAVNKNILDYFRFLKIHPEQETQPRLPLAEDVMYQQGKIGVFLYPSFLIVGIWTTYYSSTLLPATLAWRLYGGICLFVEIVFSFRMFWIAFCRFFGLRRDQLKKLAEGK